MRLVIRSGKEKQSLNRLRRKPFELGITFLRYPAFKSFDSILRLSRFLKSSGHARPSKLEDLQDLLASISFWLVKSNLSQQGNQDLLINFMTMKICTCVCISILTHFLPFLVFLIVLVFVFVCNVCVCGHTWRQLHAQVHCTASNRLVTTPLQLTRLCRKPPSP